MILQRLTAHTNTWIALVATLTSVTFVAAAHAQVHQHPSAATGVDLSYAEANALMGFEIGSEALGADPARKIHALGFVPAACKSKLDLVQVASTQSSEGPVAGFKIVSLNSADGSESGKACLEENKCSSYVSGSCLRIHEAFPEKTVLDLSNAPSSKVAFLSSDDTGKVANVLRVELIKDEGGNAIIHVGQEEIKALRAAQAAEDEKKRVELLTNNLTTCVVTEQDLNVLSDSARELASLDKISESELKDRLAYVAERKLDAIKADLEQADPAQLDRLMNRLMAWTGENPGTDNALDAQKVCSDIAIEYTASLDGAQNSDEDDRSVSRRGRSSTRSVFQRAQSAAARCSTIPGLSAEAKKRNEQLIVSIQIEEVQAQIEEVTAEALDAQLSNDPDRLRAAYVRLNALQSKGSRFASLNAKLISRLKQQDRVAKAACTPRRGRRIDSDRCSFATADVTASRLNIQKLQQAPYKAQAAAVQEHMQAQQTMLQSQQQLMNGLWGNSSTNPFQNNAFGQAGVPAQNGIPMPLGLGQQGQQAPSADMMRMMQMQGGAIQNMPNQPAIPAGSLSGGMNPSFQPLR